ncbi:hypothetical protein NYE69_30135 [Paenibacillus sp. FSL R5-0527]|uniref:hypothetical protein n=1 Tax=Paenibacillus sp. FSL R5-0527 TaxID=2975321 RepID=UPI0026944A8F
MEEIKEYWNHKFLKYEKKELEKYGFQEDTVELLIMIIVLYYCRHILKMKFL